MPFETNIERRQPVISGNPELAEELRLHGRFELSLSGRFMRETKAEHACRMIDVSVGGVSVEIEGLIEDEMRFGEKVIAYFEKIGGLEGHVVRAWEDGFAFRINATQHKREKLAAQLTFLLNEGDLRQFEGRRHDRFPVGNPNAKLGISQGVALPCLILDVSHSGASIACATRPDVGNEVWIGRLRGRVVRHHEEGIGVQFMEPVEASLLRDYFS
jgi:hypothetical protein